MKMFLSAVEKETRFAFLLMIAKNVSVTGTPMTISKEIDETKSRSSALVVKGRPS